MLLYTSVISSRHLMMSMEDGVLHWTTMSEPNVFIPRGYDIGFLSPLRCSAPFGVNCSRVNS
ncbi:unnamed protein product [Malus baccata var. baccata]|uniref:Uncharacterized protein n=1 Tax=Malus domestica TaxID=3750 RepID=A0A498KGL0_MALDO|nr:hypothetical protein DVH24_038956 [Malus domestica]